MNDGINDDFTQSNHVKCFFFNSKRWGNFAENPILDEHFFEDSIRGFHERAHAVFRIFNQIKFVCTCIFGNTN